MIKFEDYGEKLDLTREGFDELVAWATKQIDNGMNYDADSEEGLIDSTVGWFREQHDEMLADPKYFSNRIGTDENLNNFDDEETGITGYKLRQQNVIHDAVFLDMGDTFHAWTRGHGVGYDKCREDMLKLENSQEDLLELKRKLAAEAHDIAIKAIAVLFGDDDNAQELPDENHMLYAELVAMRNRAETALERAKEGKDMLECFDA